MIILTMQCVLDVVRTVYLREGVSLPDRHVLVLGQPVHDCEQVTVALQQVYAGPPGAQITGLQRCGAPRSAVLSVQVVRCVPTIGPRGQSPTAEAINESTARLSDDAWLLMDVGDTIADMAGGAVWDVDTPAPTGDLGGPLLTVTVPLGWRCRG